MKMFRNWLIASALLLVSALTLTLGPVQRVWAQAAGELLYTPTGKELITLTQPNSAANAYVPLAAVRDGAQYVYNVPTTGFTVTMTAEQSVVSLNPSGTLATGTITLPPTLYDGKIVTIFSSQTVTALTLSTSNSATFVPTAATTIAANGSLSYIYDKANNQWHRMQ